MRIGFDIAQTCVDKAGCGWYADSLIRALVQVAPEHQFFLYHQFGEWINGSTDAGTRIEAANVVPTFTDVTPQEAARIWTSPSELVVKTGGPDIVHANCYQAPKVPGARLVYTVYDVSFWTTPEYTTEANRLLCQRGTLSALENADGFIFISQSSRAEFEKVLPGWLERSGKPFAVTLLGARAAGPRTAQAADSRGYWLAVGSLEPRKNYDTLLDAMELYWRQSSRRLPLQIAGGSGWKSERLKNRIAELSARQMVKHLGYVPDEQMPKLYSGAEALIFPSWYEGFGLPVLEAMSAGCPVICSDRTSLPEVGGDAAIYIDPSSHQQIAQAMLGLEASPEVRTKLSENAWAQAARFSWAETARQTLDFYEKVLKHSESRPVS